MQDLFACFADLCLYGRQTDRQTDRSIDRQTDKAHDLYVCMYVCVCIYIYIYMYICIYILSLYRYRNASRLHIEAERGKNSLGFPRPPDPPPRLSPLPSKTPSFPGARLPVPGALWGPRHFGSAQSALYKSLCSTQL